MAVVLKSLFRDRSDFEAWIETCLTRTYFNQQFAILIQTAGLLVEAEILDR